MKKLSLIFLLLFSTKLLAQNVDSLKHILNSYTESKKRNIEDTTICGVLYLLSQYTENVESQAYCVELKDLLEERLKLLPKNHRHITLYKTYLSNTSNNLGLIYRKFGNVVKALDNFYMGLKLDEELFGKNELGVDYNNIALVYHDVGDRKKALEFFKKGLDLATLANDTGGIAYANLNIGLEYYVLDNLNEALKCFNQSLKISKIIKEKRIEAFAYNHLGLIYAKQGLYSKAMQNYDSSLFHSKISNDKSSMVSTLANIGNCYKLQKNYKGAIEYGKRALAMSTEQNEIELIRKSAYLLKEANEASGNFKEAINMYSLYIQMRDSTQNKAAKEATYKKQVEFEFEKKELLMKEEQERIKNLYEQKKRFYSILTFTLIVLMLIIFYSLYLRYKVKKEKESKNLHIELKEQLKKEIKEKESIANSLINIEEHEREKFAAELHDGVNQLLFAAKIQLQGSKSVDEEMHKQAVKLVESAIQEIKSIADNQGSFLLNNKMLSVALSDLILQMKGNKKTDIAFYNHGLEEEKLNSSQKTNVLRIIQELINNSIKHAQAKNCYVSIKSKNHKLMFAVTDNGSGMDMEHMKQGNGLKNISNKITLMKGSRRTISIKNMGTKVYVEIPII